MSQNKPKKALRHDRKKQSWPLILLLAGGLLLVVGAAVCLSKAFSTDSGHRSDWFTQLEGGPGKSGPG